jgi:hypothetical protein
MLWLLKKAVERLKTLLVTDAALDLEAAFFARQADRRAELLKQADEYETQGLQVLAEDPTSGRSRDGKRNRALSRGEGTALNCGDSH